MHGAGTRGTRQRGHAEVKAARMDAEAEAQRMVARAGVDADPIEHLLESLHRASALVEVYGRLVADLDNAGEVALREQPGRVRGWAQREWVIGPDDKAHQQVDMDPLMVATSDKTVQLHPFVREYHDALERRAKMAKLCADVGVEERRTRLAEAQGALIAKVVDGILSDLGVRDHPEAPKVVRRHLTAVAE